MGTNCSDEILEAKNCTDTGQHKYFTDPAVLNRVPLMFLVLGSIYAVMGVIAVILIAEPKEELHEDNDNDKEERVELKENDRKNLSPSQVLKTSWFYQVAAIKDIKYITNEIFVSYGVGSLVFLLLLLLWETTQRHLDSHSSMMITSTP